MVIASSKYSKKSISDLSNGPRSSKLLRRHRELRQVGVAKEGLCIYGVDDDVEGDEFVYHQILRIGHHDGTLRRKVGQCCRPSECNVTTVTY